MNSEQNYFNEMQSGAWAERNPSKCPCKGNGWVLSDLDTWHQCQMHGAGVPCPENDDGSFRSGPHKILMLRAAFKGFRLGAVRCGFTGSFNAACRKLLVGKPTPAAWVDAAEAVCTDAEAEFAEAQARREGFSCALEARYAGYAEEERRERMH